MTTKPLRVDGIDLSNIGQGRLAINYARAKRAGVKFVYHKATEGTTFVDPSYAKRRAEAKAAGIPFGAYHFARPTLTNALAEAKHFLAHAKPHPGDMLPVLDLEDRGDAGRGHDMTTPELTKWVATFLAEVHRVTGVEKAILYTPFDLNSVPKGTRLWVARYSDSNSAPRIPKPFKRYAIHQFSDGKFGVPKSVDGVGHVDINHLRDGLFGLAKLGWKTRLTLPVKTGPVPPPTPPPPAPKPRKHRVSTFNAEFGHTPQLDWAKMILARFETLQLDVLSVNEVQDYFGELKQLAEAKGHTVVGHGANSRNALVVRKGLPVSKVGTIPGDVATWFTPSGHVQSMAEPVVAEVDGVTYASVHAPVHAWVTARGGRTLTGAANRVQAYKDFTTNLVSFLSKVNEAVVLGDWNASPITRGTFSPEWVRTQVGAEYLRPNATTGHGEIDFGLVMGAKDIGKVTVVPHADFLVKGEKGGSESGEHSDHLEIWADVTFPA